MKCQCYAVRSTFFFLNRGSSKDILTTEAKQLQLYPPKNVFSGLIYFINFHHPFCTSKQFKVKGATFNKSGLSSNPYPSCHSGSHLMQNISWYTH